MKCHLPCKLHGCDTFKKRVARLCTPGHPAPSPERRSGQSLRSRRDLSQSSTSSSTHPTRFGPSRTRLGNWPAFSNLATCCGEYRTDIPQVACRLTSTLPELAARSSVLRFRPRLQSSELSNVRGSDRECASPWSCGHVLQHDGQSCVAAFVRFSPISRSRA